MLSLLKRCALKKLQDDWKAYQAQVVKNAQAMANVFMERGIKIVSNGTDNHLFLVDLIDKEYTGKDADAAWGVLTSL